jgi:hypothetical protein
MVPRQMMETINNFEIVVGLALTIWSIGLVWASWRIHIMTRELRAARVELARWVRIKGLWERQNEGRWR